jgi:hypothetical protein
MWPPPTHEGGVVLTLEERRKLSMDQRLELVENDLDELREMAAELTRRLAARSS